MAQAARFSLSAGLLLLAACAGPAPISYPVLEEADRRFAPPSATGPRSVAQTILAKDELFLEDVLAIADLMNPKLAAERKNVDLAAVQVWEAGLYPNPSVLFEVEDYKTKDISTFGRSKRTAGLSIPLALGGRLGAATDAAEKEREVATVNYLWIRRTVLSDTKRAFVGVLAARQSADLARENRDLARTLHGVTDERFKAQAIPEMEVLKAAVSLAKAEIDLKLAEKEMAASLKILQVLLGDADFPRDKFGGTLASRYTVPSLEALRGMVTTGHPQLLSAQKSKEAADLHLGAARSERIPDIALEFRGGIDSEGDSIVQGGIAIPIPFWNRNQAKIAAAEIRIRQAEFLIQDVRNDILLRLTEAYRNFIASQERVAVYEDDIMPKAQKAFTQTNEGYRQGKFGYLDLLDAQRTLADAKVAYAAAVADLNLSAAELERQTGMRVERVR